MAVDIRTPNLHSNESDTAWNVRDALSRCAHALTCEIALVGCSWASFFACLVVQRDRADEIRIAAIQRKQEHDVEAAREHSTGRAEAGTKRKRSDEEESSEKAGKDASEECQATAEHGSRTDQGAPSLPQAPMEKEKARLPIGTLAVIYGITSKKHYNGLKVIVQAHHQNEDKYNVKLLQPDERNDVKLNVIVKGGNLLAADAIERASKIKTRQGHAVKGRQGQSRDDRAAARAVAVAAGVRHEAGTQDKEDWKREWMAGAKQDACRGRRKGRRGSVVGCEKLQGQSRQLDD